MTSMIMSFTRNDAAAKSLDGGTFISQTGAYTGQITQASMGMSDGGAQFLDIAFKADDGRLCFSKLFLSKKDGSEAFGRRILDALLVVCNAQKADVVEGKVFTRDRNAAGGFRVDQGYRLPAVEKHHVGLVFQRENRLYNGKPTYQMNLVTPFDPATRKVAKEILNGDTEAKLLDARLKNLKDRDSTGGATGEQQPPANHPAVAAPMDDDPPF